MAAEPPPLRLGSASDALVGFLAPGGSVDFLAGGGSVDFLTGGFFAGGGSVDFLAGGGSAGLLAGGGSVDFLAGGGSAGFLAGGGSAGFLAGGRLRRLFGGRRLRRFLSGGFLAGLVRWRRSAASSAAGCPAWRQGPADVHAQFLQFGLHLFPVLLRRRRREFLLVEPRANLLVLFIAVAVERIRGLDIPMIVFLAEVA